jgi:hypothetical protein
MQIEVLETVTKTIGSLALAYPYLRRLRVAEAINDVVTAGKQRVVPTGQVIEVLILNRLSLRPVPISKIGAWAQTQADEEVYGLAADALNDDRIGRALDEIPPPGRSVGGPGAARHCGLRAVPGSVAQRRDARGLRGGLR